MFSSLRTNSLLYILDKSSEPSLRTASVTSVSAPQQKFNAYNPLNPETTVDVTIKFDSGETMDLRQMPCGLSVANFGTTIVTETKEQMAQEVESMMRSSKAVIESVPYHEKVIGACEEMMGRLNPQIAKEKQTEDRLNKIEDMLSKLLMASAK